MKPEVLALIPARGGSKGVPRKNVLPVAGKPLLVWSIDHARAATSVTRVLVSTDDDEIAAVALAHGAEVPFRRPPEHATDAATDLDVFRHALLWLVQHEGALPELVVHLRPTAPIREPGAIDRAVERMLADPTADALRSVGPALQTPYKMWRIVDGVLEPVVRIQGVAEAHSMPRQALPVAYWQNGHVDVVRPRAVLEQGSMVGQRCLAFVIRSPGDLDYPEQLPELERGLLRQQEGRTDPWTQRLPT
ncbi:MAG: acylneuraminate cytidylyltransferase family protein [Polyangiaceae bacterium]|nr:acylneuraminate cytidylyltransferase family protein [Polyangiaceae bacterium]